MRNNIASYPHIFMKLNQSLLLNTIQSPSSSPDHNSDDSFFNRILNEWLAFFPNLINSMMEKIRDTFTNFVETLSQWLAFFPNLINSVMVKMKDTFTNLLGTLAHWLAVAATYLIAGVGIVALCLVLLLYLPVIVRCFAWLMAACWTVISEVFTLLWPPDFDGFFLLLWRMCRCPFMLVSRMCRSLHGMCCLCGRHFFEMMKACATAARAVFETNPGPAAYFSNLLRAGLCCLMFNNETHEESNNITTDRQKMKETDEYKRAMEGELAARQQQLLHQAEEARKLKNRKKAEKLRQKERLEEIRQTWRKDEEKLNLKEKLRVEVKNELKGIEVMCSDMGSLLGYLGIHVGGGPYPSPNEVQAAYKRACFKFHPDRISTTDLRQQVEAEEKFKLISNMKMKKFML